MGVGAPQGADAAIEIIAQRQLFAGGLRVEIHQCEVRVPGFQQPVRQREGVFGVPLQAAAADEAHYANPHAVAVKNLTAVSRCAGGEVSGAQEPVGLVQQRTDFHFAEGMVPQRYGIGPGVIDPQRLLAGQARGGDVFTVYNGEGNVFQLLQGAEMAL